MLILHIRSLGPDSLANKIYVEQRTHNWPGLAKETKQICEDLELEDCNTILQERNSYKTAWLHVTEVMKNLYGCWQEENVEGLGWKNMAGKNILEVKIPHTGDTESLDRC